MRNGPAAWASSPERGTRRGHPKEQSLAVLRQAESGTTVTEVCRNVGISEQTFSVGKRTHAGLGLSELREENTKLKCLVADLSRDRRMLQEIVRNTRYGLGAGGPWPAGRR